MDSIYVSHVELACTGCEKVYKLATAKLPKKGAKTKCKQCKTPIVIKPAKYYADNQSINPPKSPKYPKIASASNSSAGAQSENGAVNTQKDNQTIKSAAKSVTVHAFSNEQKTAEKLKAATIIAKAKSEDAKSRALIEFNKLDNTSRTALVIVLCIVTFFLLTSILKPVTFLGALFERFVAIFFLSFFVLMVLGCVKGVKKQVVVYYDKKDVFNSFKILGSLILTFLGFNIAMSAILGSDLANSAPVKFFNVILCVTVPAYFLYLGIAASLFHNQEESTLNKASAVCAKIGIGILYPLVILSELNNIGTHTTKDCYGNVTTRHHSAAFLIIFMALGGALIWKLINGDAVYAKRSSESHDGV